MNQVKKFLLILFWTTVLLTGVTAFCAAVLSLGGMYFNYAHELLGTRPYRNGFVDFGIIFPPCVLGLAIIVYVSDLFIKEDKKEVSNG